MACVGQCKASSFPSFEHNRLLEHFEIICHSYFTDCFIFFSPVLISK